MAAITQRIDNYLGGVSKQSDDKKLLGQVRECINGYPDPTFGLTKRPGLKWVSNLATGTTLDNCKWFYIHRDGDEKYIGCITPKPNSGNGEFKIWNATTGVACTIHYDAIPWVANTAYEVGALVQNDSGKVYICDQAGTSAGSGGPTGTGANITDNTTRWDYQSALVDQGYLTGARTNYDVLTVQDTSIITNNLITVTTEAAPTFVEKKQATFEITGTVVTGDVYIATVNGTACPYTAVSGDGFNEVLTGLKTAIDANTTGFTTTKYKKTVQVTRATAFTASAEGGLDNSKLKSFQDEVDTVADLPVPTFHNHLLKITNSSSNDVDSYWAVYKADDGVSGTGTWEEDIDPGVSTGLTETSMPHELLNIAVNTFLFKNITWTKRLVGDDRTNKHPSFVGQQIQQSFFHNNRLGFLSKDNVSLSRAPELGDPQFYNMYAKSARIQIDSDPVDISCSTIRPAALHAVIPTSQGLVLFSKNQQFLMAAADGVLTPNTTTVRSISNYEMDTLVDPVDMGTNINFLSKTPSYTRIFGMVTRGQDENPQVLDIGRVVNEWVPDSIDTLIASTQNQFIAMSDQGSNKIYFYRTYSDGEKQLMQSWYNWQVCGTVQAIASDSDELFIVSKQGSQFSLSRASMSQSPDDAIIVSNQGQKVNPCMDLYATANPVQYNSVETITITAGGSGYSSAPTVTITGSGTGPEPGTPGSGATATATVSGGAVTAITLTNGGSLYHNGAVVSFSGGGGTNAAATASVYDGTKCYLKYENDANLTPVLLIAGSTATGQFIESGFTITPDRGTDGLGTYFKVPQKDLTGSSYSGDPDVEDDVYTGWKYDLDVQLPKTYFRLNENQTRSDFTSNLTIARMKFAVGLSGVMSFKLKSKGVTQGSIEYVGDGTKTDFNWIEADISYIDRDQVKVKVDNVVQQTTAFSFLSDTSIRLTSAPTYGAKVVVYLDEWYNLNPTATANDYLGNDVALAEQSVFTIPIHQKNTNFDLRIFNDSPFPVALNSMMWEGNYTPRYYTRK